MERRTPIQTTEYLLRVLRSEGEQAAALAAVAEQVLCADGSQAAALLPPAAALAWLRQIGGEAAAPGLVTGELAELPLADGCVLVSGCLTPPGAPAPLCRFTAAWRAGEAGFQLSALQLSATRPQAGESAQLLRLAAAHSQRRLYRYWLASRTAIADGDSGEVLSDLPESMIEKGRILPESVKDIRTFFQRLHAGQPEGCVKLHLQNTDGTPRWLDLRYSLLSGEGTAESALLSLADVTEEHEKELAYGRYRQSVSRDGDEDGLFYFETDLTLDRIEKQGGGLSRLHFPPVGCTHFQAACFGADHLLPPDERPRARDFFSRERLLSAFTEGKRALRSDWPVTLRTGGRLWYRSSIQMIEDPYSGHIKAYFIFRNITEEKTAVLEIQKKAETDGLTGLYNKVTAEARIRRHLAEQSGGCALLVADLDDLKAINDRLGHAQGDRAIRIIAATLKNQFRHTDVVGRIGGDEFVAFLDGAGGQAQLDAILRSLMSKLAACRIGEEDTEPIHWSIGAALGQAGTDSFEELYRRADKALYYVKRNGKNNYTFYQPELEQGK